MDGLGHPHLMDDVNDWEEKIHFPDIESWDWAGSAERNVKIRNTGRANMLMFLNGMGFERLISFMGFEDAAMALLDEDQEDALHGLLHALCDLHIAMVDKAIEYYHIDGINLHDDWGSQQAPFFSEEAGRNFFLPEMKRLNDHIHERGLFCDLHSCGHIEDRCNLLVEAGFDAWTPMAMNNTAKLYDDWGDKMAIAVVTDTPFDPETATEVEQREAARHFVERFGGPGKQAFFSGYNKPGQLTRAFREEMYKASREAYAR